MKFFACVLLAVAATAAPEADPALLYSGLGYGGLYGGYAGVYGGYSGLGLHGLGYAAPVVAAPVVTYSTPTVGAVASVGATPVAVGGYKAVAGDNGGLKGAVHEVPGLVGAPLLATQESAGAVSLTTGTGAYAVTGHTLHHAIGKREAEADPAYFYSGLGYGHGLYGLGYGYGAGYAGYGYGLGYRTHGYGLGYRTHGYGHYIGKRSADAEPAADADADAYYGYAGYGYGHHGYGYGGYYGGYGRGYYGGYGYGHGLGYGRYIYGK